MPTATQEALLDFDGRQIHKFDRRKAIELLAGEHADAYETHLVAAHWIDHWREGVLGSAGAPARPSEDWHEGFDHAMKEIAAHLRLGDFLPGAQPYEQTVSGLKRA
jgi:hypothetical protein